MGFRSLEATKARVIRRTRREIFRRFFFFAVRLAADFFLPDCFLLWLLLVDCPWRGDAKALDAELHNRESATASTGTQVFTIEFSLARETVAQKRTIVVSQVLDDFLVEIAGRAGDAAAVALFIGGPALLDIFLQAFVEVPILLGCLHLGLVIELDFVDQQFGEAPGLTMDCIVLSVHRSLSRGSGAGRSGCRRGGHGHGCWFRFSFCFYHRFGYRLHHWSGRGRAFNRNSFAFDGRS